MSILIPGTTVGVPLLTYSIDSTPIDATATPVAVLYINGDETDIELNITHKSKGVYKISFVIPNDYPIGSIVTLLREVVVEGHTLRNAMRLGVIIDINKLATKEQLQVVNNALKLMSLDAGIIHTQDLPE